MRFLHIGDIHLGPNDRNADRLAALDQIIAEGLDLNLDAWLIPGDLNHARMTIADRNALVSRFKVMAAVAPVVITPGNHDLPGDLDIFAELGTAWPVYVVTTPQVLFLRTAQHNGKAAIFVLPYPSRAGIVAAGTPSEQVGEAAKQALDVIFMSAGAELEKARSEGWTTLMIGHVNVGGSISSSGQPNIGKEIELDPTLLQRLGNVPVLLNHIHKAQEIGGARYAGSICRLDWGEIEPKQYLLLEATSGVFAWRVDARPINVPPMYHVEGKLTRDGFEWGLVYDGEEFKGVVSDFTGADVRVRFRYVAAEKAALDFSLVTAPFAGARRVETDPIAEHTRALRAPEIAQAQTLEQKTEAFVRNSGTAWTPGLQTKLAALQVPDGAAFLNAIEPEAVCQ
jgi:hypothetical protein